MPPAVIPPVSILDLEDIRAVIGEQKGAKIAG
jgi:hypothetical protein